MLLTNKKLTMKTKMRRTTHPQTQYARTPQPTNSTIDWKKLILVTGKAGTGKTHCLLKAIDESLEDERQILVATPTGFLATTDSEFFLNEITADMVHNAFKYPVLPYDHPQINWDLGHYDLIVMDEVSMIPKRIAEHIITER